MMITMLIIIYGRIRSDHSSFHPRYHYDRLSPSVALFVIVSSTRRKKEATLCVRQDLVHHRHSYRTPHLPPHLPPHPNYFSIEIDKTENVVTHTSVRIDRQYACTAQSQGVVNGGTARFRKNYDIRYQLKSKTTSNENGYR
jgi:hypothetical protein